MQSQGRPQISSGNVRPDAPPASGWGCRVLGMEIAYHGFDLDHVCLLPEPQNSHYTRMVYGCLLRCMKLQLMTPKQEGHHVITEPQAPHSLQRCMRNIPAASVFQSLSRHCVMIMYSAMSLFSNYLSISRDSRVVSYVEDDRSLGFLFSNENLTAETWSSNPDWYFILPMFNAT